VVKASYSTAEMDI